MVSRSRPALRAGRWDKTVRVYDHAAYAMRHKLAEEEGVEVLPEQLSPPYMVEWTCSRCGQHQANVEITGGNELVPNPRKICECGQED